jgi:hypothetical protein
VSSEVLAMAIIVVVHVIGLGVLLGWAMLGDQRIDWGDGRRDDDSGRSAPGGLPPGSDGLPLPDAVQSPARLREAGRIGGWHRHRRSVPSHHPSRAPRHAPARSVSPHARSLGDGARPHHANP